MHKKLNATAITVASCWLTYLTAYLCRVNFSSAMGALSAERGFSTSQLGAVGAVFYAVYAVGQLINGYVGDHVRANRFLLLALAGTALCNVGAAIARSFALMIALWGLNGCFQSMFWSTIIRLLAQKTPAGKRSTVSAVISLAMPAAYLVSWSVLGRLLEGGSASPYFLIPAACALVMAAVWAALSLTVFRHAAGDAAPSKAGIRDTLRFLNKENLMPLIAVCLIHGFIKESVNYWTPLLIADMPGAARRSPFLLAAILPFANLIGILASRSLLGRFQGGAVKVIALMLLGISLTGAGLTAGRDVVLIVGLMALISGMSYANNTILMSYIPMQYTARNMVASLIGVFDFASYAGAAVSTYALGRLFARVGFKPAPIIWMCAAAVGCAIALSLAIRQRKNAARIKRETA